MKEVEISRLIIPQGLLPRVITGTVEEVVERYQNAVESGEKLPPIKVWKRGEEYWVVDGVHRLSAYKRLGLSKVEVEVLELPDEISYRKEAIRANVRHGLPLKNEEKRENMRILYTLGEKSVDELAKLFAVSQKTAYNWLSDLLEKEKQELKKKAIQLREQGKTQEEIARELGVPRTTLSEWLKPSLTKIVNLQKSSKTLSLDYQAPDDTLLSLLSQYFAERPEGERGIAKFVDWLKNKGYQVSEREWESFRDGLVKVLESLYVRNLDRSPQERREALLQGLKAYKKVRERIVEDFVQLVGKTIDKEWEAVREVPCSADIDPQEWIKGRLSESRFLKRHANQVLALLQDKIEECLKAYPYLTLEEVQVEDLLEVESKEELEKALRERHKNKRIRKDLVEELYRRLEEEKSKVVALARVEEEEEVIEGVLEEERLEELFQELFQEEDKKGLGLKGVLKELGAILKGLEKVEELLEGGQVEKAKKVVASLKERISKDIEKVETSLQKRSSADRDAVRVAYSTAKTFRDYYRQWAGMEMPEEDFRKGMKALIRILNKEKEPELFREPLKEAVERYFMRKGEMEDRYVGKVSLFDFANNLSTYIADTNRMAMFRNAMVVRQQLEELRNGKGY